MEMTIANPIQTLKYLRTSGVFPFSTKEGILYLAESLDVVIDTMRKYQKIEQIVNEYNLQLCNSTSDGAYNFQRIREVIEDGNNTN